MGKFIYGTPSISVEFDDRVLAHLKAVIVAKLRRNEAFTFSWEYDAALGTGNSSVWLHPSIPMQFEFYGSRAPQLNRAWLEALVQLSNTPGGLRVIPEPKESAGSGTPAAE